MTAHKNHNLERLKEWILEGANPVTVTGIFGSLRSYFFAQFLTDLKKPCLAILPSKKEAEKLHKELRFFMPEEDLQGDSSGMRLHEFPPYDLTPLTGLSPHKEVVTRRLQSLYSLVSDPAPVVITSLEAVSLKIMPKKTLVQSLEYLEVGEDADRDKILQKLEMMGYQRSSLVEEGGDYSVRGGVIDLFSPLYPLPVRLEFWGDRIESIRRFDPLSQRSQNHLNEMILIPASEIILDRENVKRARSMGRLPKGREAALRFSGQEAWLNHFYPRLDTLFEYLPQNGLVVFIDSLGAESVSRKLQDRFQEDVERFRKESARKNDPFPETGDLFVPYGEIAREVETHQRLYLNQLNLDHADGPGNAIHIKNRFQQDMEFEVRLPDRGRVSMAPLAEKIASWLDARARVVLVSRTEQQSNRLKEILENYQVPVTRQVQNWGRIPEKPGLTMCLGQLSKGFTWPDQGLYVVSEDEIFGSKRAPLRPKRKARESALTWSSFSQLRNGNLVVHEEHGVGRYGGLLRMEIAHKVNDFVLVEYSHNDRLYIPADRISILQKYVGADEKDPKLDRLGGRSWNIAKEKARKSVRTIAKQLVEIYALRKFRKGYAFSPPDHYFKEFEATFEHEETPDQIKAIDDVLEDMASRMKELGSVRKWVGDKWYWVIKPDSKPGERIEI